MTINEDKAEARHAAVEFVVCTLIWGSTWLVIKGQLGVVPVAWSVAYRFIIAGAVLYAVARATGRWERPGRSAHGFALVAGIAQFALNYLLVYAAEQHLTSGLVALVFALLIIPNAILSRIFLKSSISLRFIMGSAIGLVGLALVFGDDVLTPAGRDARSLGLVLAVLSVLSASVANVMQGGGLARSLPPLPTLALMMFYGTLADIGYALVTVGAPVFDPRPEYWLGLAYLAVVASALAFTVYFRLIRRVGPSAAAYSGVVIPVVAMTLSTVFEGYRWTVTGACGAALALIGLAVALGSRRARPADGATAG